MLEGPSTNGHASNGDGEQRAHAGRTILMIAVVSAITWLGALAIGLLVGLLWPGDNPIEKIWQGIRWSPVGAVVAAWFGAFVAIQVTGRKGEGRLRACAWGAVAGVVFAVGVMVITLSESRAGDVALTISGIPFIGPLVAMGVFLSPGIAAALATAFAKPKGT